MRLDELDYHLPPDPIAQHPLPERDASRLLVVRRGATVAAHHVFRDLPGLLQRGDLLVLNNTRVLPARLIGRRERTGGKWEGLFLHEPPDGLWEMPTQTGARPAVGETVLVEAETVGEPLRVVLVGRTPEGRWLVRSETVAPAAEFLARYGRVPLPPYIRKGRAVSADRERYQTGYADRPGAIAAPTAGLQLTTGVFEELDRR